MFLFIFLIGLYLLIPAFITQIFNAIAELVFHMEIPTKEAKKEIETNPVIVEITISESSV